MLEQTWKVFEIVRRVSEQQKLRERQLPFTEYSKSRNKRFATVTFLYHSRCERVKASLTIRPKITH